MKKLFYFFALSAIVLGMASCGDGNDPDNKKFQFSANIRNNTINVKVNSADPNKYFYFGCMKGSTFLQRPVVFVNSELSDLKKGTFPDGLFQEYKSKYYENLLEGTDYAIYACEVDENYNIVGDVEYVLARTEGAMLGRFTINSSGKKVRFAPGNLQGNIDEDNNLRMATEQWELVTNDGKKWEDLLEWNITQKKPINVVNNVYADWRALTKEEWSYMLETRQNAGKLRGYATVNGIRGMVILPDNWRAPSSPKFKAELTWTANQYSIADWAILEDAGAVFIPAAGMWMDGAVSDYKQVGYYWTATSKVVGEVTSYTLLCFVDDNLPFFPSKDTNMRASIRCVLDVK